MHTLSHLGRGTYECLHKASITKTDDFTSRDLIKKDNVLTQCALSNSYNTEFRRHCASSCRVTSIIPKHSDITHGFASCSGIVPLATQLAHATKYNSDASDASAWRRRLRVGQVTKIVLLQASLTAQPIATNTMTCRVRADQNSSIIIVSVKDGMMQSASLKELLGACRPGVLLLTCLGQLIGQSLRARALQATHRRKKLLFTLHACSMLHVHALGEVHQGVAQGLRLKVLAGKRAKGSNGMVARAIHNENVTWPNLYTSNAVEKCQFATCKWLLLARVLRCDGHKSIGGRRVFVSVHAPAEKA